MQSKTPSDLPSYSTRPGWKYDVFLSFRGKDTRKSFASHLYSALDQKGIFTFKDNHKLERGKIISLELFKAIEESRFAVIVFSENYAFSTWCLDELAKILQCMKLMGQKVLPVFYNVNPSEVRNQTGSFEKAFAEHEHNFSKDLEKVQRWRVAMTEIANLSGWHLQNREESKFIQAIVDEISSKLGPTFLNTSGKLVGMELRMKQIDPLLALGLNDVRMLGLCGMGGIGKTTLARFVFDKISYQFDGCSFLANIREVSMTRGLVSLQQQLISEILRERNINIWDAHIGSIEIMRRLWHKRVLVILDDVDQIEQLQALAGMHNWFGVGSRIIITTRNRHLLVRHGVDNVHMVNGLNCGDACKLFCWKAFRNCHPSDDFLELSLQMIRYVDGLPLALEVLGSFLFGRSKAEWKDALDRLKEVPEERIFEILKISYDGLQELEKKIFLDVACFFEGRDKDDVRQILDSCDFHPDIGISVLIDKCIISLSNNILRMHDLIKCMGREIVRQEGPIKPGQRSRLWLSNDVYRVLTKNEGTEAVEGIILDFPAYEELKLNAKSFSGMNNLRLLKIRDVSLCQGLEYLSDELRLLNWHGYPLRSLPVDFQHNKLFELNMCYSHIKQLWKGVKHLNQLKIIILSHSTYLIKTPDFTGAPNLERLILDGCTSLSFLHPSVGLLKRLISLNLKDCKQLRRLVAKIEWESLEVLILSGCSKLNDVQEIIANAKNLLQLLLGGTAIKELPSSIQHLTGLIMLDLRDCRNLISLPNSICDLTSLKVLNISGCSKVDKVPEDLGHMASLEDLDFGGTAVSQLPSSVALLKNLKRLSFHGCKGESDKSRSSLSKLFSWFPTANPNSTGLRLPSSWSNLSSLRDLDLGDCNIQEGAIPSDIGFLPSLIKLNLSRNNFVSLPASISQLPQLETLIIDYCDRLQALPELPASTLTLFAQNCTSLEIISSPSNISSSLSRMFYLNNCFKLAGSGGSNSVTFSFFENVLYLLLKGQLQGVECLITQPEFEIVIPGSQVPDWFFYRSKGASIKIFPYMQLYGDIFKGMALCAAFSVHLTKGSVPDDKLIGLYCVLEIDNFPRRTHSLTLTIDSLAKSDHVWLIYYSRDYLFDKYLQVSHSLSVVSFQYANHDCVTLKVKECGFRPVYNSDAEKIIRASNNPSSSTSSEVWVHNRLAVTSTIKKRSHDYYSPDQQLYPKRLR